MERFSKKILSTLPIGEYFGRTAEFEAVVRHARKGGGLRLVSAPRSGASEVLRRVYDHLFFEQAEIVPVYFALRSDETSSDQAAQRFLTTFVTQVAAFRRRDASIADRTLDLREAEQNSLVTDLEWVRTAIEHASGLSQIGDSASFVRSCLSVPARAGKYDIRAFVILDDLHNSRFLSDGDTFVSAAAEGFGSAELGFAVSARRRIDLPFRLPFLEVDDLEQKEASEFTARLAASLDVATNEQSCDLIGLQLRGNVGAIKTLITNACRRGQRLDSFQSVEDVYSASILDGSLSGPIEAAVSFSCESPSTERKLVEALFEGVVSTGNIRIEALEERIGLPAAKMAKALRVLDSCEVITMDGSLVAIDKGDIVLADYLRVRTAIEAGKPRTVIAGELLTNSIKRAPKLMAFHYREMSSLGLAGILRSFDSQKVPRGLFDYRHYSESYKGLPDDEIIRRLLAEKDSIELPQVVHTAPVSHYYRPLDSLIDAKRAVVGLGFDGRHYVDDGQTAWIAAEVDSKLEAKVDLAEFWCDRLEMAAIHSGFEKYKVWLIAPEGFTPEALDVLEARDAIGTSRKQAEYLRDFLNAGDIVRSRPVSAEYEMVIPVGNDTELIAAHSLEEIARRHHFPPRTINQIKTALVEACINAAEHGLSPDGKIYQKFVVDDEKITITISNRGLRLADAAFGASAGVAVGDPFGIPSGAVKEGRRGWGLNLIRGLMDEVRIESVDDGTRITMVKRIPIASAEAA